jgi:hypothetical protein
MAFELPDLPYPYDAPEPHVDEATMRVHHDAHHAAYVNNANAALEGTEWADASIESVLASIDAMPEDKQAAVRNNAGGHANHSVFWTIMSPDGGGAPSGDLAAHAEPRADPRHRRLGARLLPQVPEQAPRLPRGVVERRPLAGGRAPLHGSEERLSESRFERGSARHQSESTCDA